MGKVVPKGQAPPMVMGCHKVLGLGLDSEAEEDLLRANFVENYSLP